MACEFLWVPLVSCPCCFGEGDKGRPLLMYNEQGKISGVEIGPVVSDERLEPNIYPNDFSSRFIFQFLNNIRRFF